MTATAAEIREWLVKAEMDYRSALRLGSGRNPIAESACFHCQQTAEKYLKAFLISKGVRFPKIHDLERLLLLCARLEPRCKAAEEEIILLSPYSVDIRYPGEDATRGEAREAIRAARSVRRLFRGLLRLRS